jgi:hypothetical protein
MLRALLPPLMMVHLIRSLPAAVAADNTVAAADKPPPRALCYLELIGHSSSNLGTPLLQAANLTCTSSNGHPVPVSANMSRLLQQNSSSEAALHNITLSGVREVVDAECKEQAAILDALGFQPLLFFCGNYNVVLVSPVVQQVHVQDAQGAAATGCGNAVGVTTGGCSTTGRSIVVFAFAGRMRASISKGSFHNNSLGSIVVLSGNASMAVTKSAFNSNQLTGSCIRGYGSSTLHVAQTAFDSNTAYASYLDGGAVLRIAGSARAEFKACSLVNSTATAPNYTGTPFLSARWGGAVHANEQARLVMQSCLLQGNRAEYGAGVWAGGTSEVHSSSQSAPRQRCLL